MPLPRLPILDRRANRGKFAEDLLESVHEVYRLEGRADLTKIPTPIGRGRPLPEQKQRFEAWYTKKATSDYLGTLAPDGRALALELKSVEGGRFHLSRLPPHQRVFLERQARCGGLAYVLVVFIGETRCPPAAVLKWPDFAQESARSGSGEPSFTWAQLAVAFHASATVLRTGMLHPDYLPAIWTVEHRLAAAAVPPAGDPHPFVHPLGLQSDS